VRTRVSVRRGGGVAARRPPSRGTRAAGPGEARVVAGPDGYAYPERMSEESLGYEIRESSDLDGSLQLELLVEGTRVAHATVHADVLADMWTVLGLTRDAVAQALREALLKSLRAQGQFVEVGDLKEDAHKPLRFTGRFTYRLRDQVSTGLVWYDVSSSTTGPEDLPAVVRNKMRFTVHRKLTGEGSAARALVDLHK
jgi:hypothetical protein